MRKINMNSLVKKGSIVGALSILMTAFSATAIAQCGVSFASMAEVVASIQPRPQDSKPSVQSKSADLNVLGDEDDDALSIVGLWHIKFMAGGQVIQEAFQTWSQGGTEAHNPNVDPRGGSICLGAWKRGAHGTFRLTHRVWNYNTAGTFNGTINLSETLTLGSGGNTHTGTFTLDFYDPAGNFLFEVPGTVVGERISVN